MAYVWMNDRLVKENAAHISIRDRGFLLSDGLFETLRIQGGTLRNKAAHCARLQRGAAVLGIDVPACVEDALDQMLAANAFQQGSMRLTLTRGSGGRGLDLPEAVSPFLLITATAHSPVVHALNVRVIPSFRRDEVSPLVRIKALGYLPNIMARREAQQLHADDALMPNTSGKLASATVANVLLWRDGCWTTPPVTDGALPGTGRAALLAEGLVQECSWPLEALVLAEGIALVNALSLRPVQQCDGRSLAWPLEACESFDRMALALELPVEQ